MDGRGFDELARRLATGTSRRSILRGMFTGGAALLATKAGSGLAAQPAKVTICHYPPGNRSNVQVLSVSPSAVAAHVANHGDTVLGTVASCISCGDVCTAPDACTPASCDVNGCNTVSACTGVETCGGGGTVGACGCTSDDPAVTCEGLCGPQVDNCNRPVDCGACCTPDCTNQTCGDDGCGGSCGECAAGDVCNASGACQSCSTCGGYEQCGTDSQFGFCGTVCDAELGVHCLSNRPCDQDLACTSSDECPAGEFCLPGNCCGFSVCLPVCDQAGASAKFNDGADGADIVGPATPLGG